MLKQFPYNQLSRLQQVREVPTCAIFNIRFFPVENSLESYFRLSTSGMYVEWK